MIQKCTTWLYKVICKVWMETFHMIQFSSFFELFYGKFLKVSHIWLENALITDSELIELQSMWVIVYMHKIVLYLCSSFHKQLIDTQKRKVLLPHLRGKNSLEPVRFGLLLLNNVLLQVCFKPIGFDMNHLSNLKIDLRENYSPHFVNWS